MTKTDLALVLLAVWTLAIIITTLYYILKDAQSGNDQHYRRW